MNSYGLHLMGGLLDCSKVGMHEERYVKDFLLRTVDELGMSAMGEPHLDAYTGPYHEWDGFSGTVHIQTSHITCHVFAFGYVFVDAFSCRPFDVAGAKIFIEDQFEPFHAEWQVVQRGFNFPRELRAR